MYLADIKAVGFSWALFDVSSSRSLLPLQGRPSSAIAAVSSGRNLRDQTPSFDSDRSRRSNQVFRDGYPSGMGGTAMRNPAPDHTHSLGVPHNNASRNFRNTGDHEFGTPAEAAGDAQAHSRREAAAPLSRRDAKERAVRKAARIAEKTATAQRSSQGCCYGCGAPLQTEVPQGPGYVAADKYALKKQRKQLDKVLCGRCSELCNGAMIPAVQDFTQKLQLRQMLGVAAAAPNVSGARPADSGATASVLPGGSDPKQISEAETLSLLGKVLVTPEQLRSQLTPLALRAAVVVLLVDTTDASGTLMARVRDMVGRNPIILVGTKTDLLPEGWRPREVAEWLSGAAASKKLNVVSVHLVSSHTGEGMPPAVSRICRERKSRDVYVVGAANVGKSAFVRAMLKEMARTEPAAIGTGKYLPVESAMPGTTLGLIPLKAFSSGGILFDTPGVHLHHRIPHMLSPAELKLLHPRRPLTAYVPSLPADFSGPHELPTSNRTAELSGASGADISGRLGNGGAVRQGRGGLKIVDHVPTDEYGMPIRGLDAGVRRGASAGRGAADGAAACGDVPSPSAPQQQQVQATYMWSDLVRVDVLSGPPDTALVFYGPSSMRVVALPYIRPDQQLEIDYGGGGDQGPSKVLVCTDSVAARGGLQPHELVVRATGASAGTATADVAISGLPGWVAVWTPRAKKDVRLRVWVPRGVDVLLRPAFPCPVPLSLQRAWRGERRGGDDSDKDEEGEEAPELAELSRALVAGGVSDPTSDPQWWESMAALKDKDMPGYGAAAAATSLRRRRSGSAASRLKPVLADVDDSDDADLADWAGEAELNGEEDEQDDDEERIVVSATVEDILRRPRLDVLAQMDLDAEDDEEGEADDDEISGFTLTKAAAGRRRLEGPQGDGQWNPMELDRKSARSASASASSAASSSGRRQGGSPRMGLRRRAEEKNSDVEAAVAEAEEAEEVGEEEWAEAEELTPATGGIRRRAGLRRMAGARSWLSRRRRGATNVASGEEGEVE